MDRSELVACIETIIAHAADPARSPTERELAERALRRIAREAFPFTVAPHRGEPRVQRPPARLHLGSGSQKLDGFFNIDLVEGADLRWDIRVGLPFPDSSVSMIFSEHFLEHIDRDFSVPRVLKECARVLEPGGSIIIGVPDAGAAAQAWAANSSALSSVFAGAYSRRPEFGEIYFDDFDLVALVFHDAYADQRYNPHFWGYSQQSLCKLLSSAGFLSVEPLTEPPRFSNPRRHLGSIYVEARAS